jgi:putative ATPase
MRDVEQTRNDPVPLHLRNAVTGLMRDMGYGRGYKYAHDYEGATVDQQQHLPDKLAGRTYYRAKDLGWEGRRKRERAYQGSEDEK